MDFLIQKVAIERQNSTWITVTKITTVNFKATAIGIIW